MQFNSLVYIVAFLPFVFVVYQLLRTTRFANIFLATASFVFYAWVALWFLIPLLISSVLDYFVGRRMAVEEEDRKRKRLLILSVFVNLGLLSFFKYTGWISLELAHLAGILGLSISAVGVPLPPGISFYTFQTMSYTIDVYKGEFAPRRNFINYLSFVSFFPQLVAGPIERASHLLPQLEKVRPRVSLAVASGACFMILFGLFQKTVLADNFGAITEFIDQNITNKGELAPGLGLLFAYAFAFQIYCDFSAYSTIARGTARLFGIDLMRNFATPYFSSSPSEFWNRWHISLSSWLRDYLYIPLGGNRHGRLLTLRNLIITMTLGGLWHGAGLLFIIWGLWHGLLLVFYRLVPIDEFLIRRLGRVGKVISVIVFFHLTCVGWIFFRASEETIGPIWSSILATPQIVVDAVMLYEPYFGKAGMWTLVEGIAHAMRQQNWTLYVAAIIFGILLIPAAVTDYLGYRRNEEFADRWHSMAIPTRIVLVVALFYAIAMFAVRESNEFIYFAF